MYRVTNYGTNVRIQWNTQAVIHYSFLQPGEPITTISYREIDVDHDKLMTVFFARRDALYHTITHDHIKLLRSQRIL